MTGARRDVVVNVAAALVAVGVLVALVLLAAPDASLGTTDRDVRPLAPSADPRLLSAPRAPDAAPPVLTPAAPTRTGSVRTCTDADVDVAVVPLAEDARSGSATGPRRAAVQWVNRATSPCRMDGFGIVSLIGADQPHFGWMRYGSILDVGRSSEKPRPTTLAPGESARSVLQWTPPDPADGRAWTPDRLVVASPGEARNQTLPWRLGPVLALGASGRPAATFGPVAGG